jgi:hypothetical protein
MDSSHGRILLQNCTHYTPLGPYSDPCCPQTLYAPGCLYLIIQLEICLVCLIAFFSVLCTHYVLVFSLWHCDTQNLTPKGFVCLINFVDTDEDLSHIKSEFVEHPRSLDKGIIC